MRVHLQVIMILLKNAGSTWICPWHVDNATSFPRSLSSAPCWNPTAKGTAACPGKQLEASPSLKPMPVRLAWGHLKMCSQTSGNLGGHDKGVEDVFFQHQAGLECRSNEGHLPYFAETVFCWDYHRRITISIFVILENHFGLPLGEFPAS